MRQSNAVIAHDSLGQLCKIAAPTQITLSRFDIVTSTRFAEPLTNGIRNADSWCPKPARMAESTKPLATST